MDKRFSQKNFKNLLDDLIIDVKKLYEDFSVDKKIKQGSRSLKKNYFNKIYKSCLMPVKYRNYFWHFFRRLHLDLSWFNKFNSYWTSVLKGRPFWSPYDLYFLKTAYRLKFQKRVVWD